jgi:hypothetical protein
VFELALYSLTTVVCSVRHSFLLSLLHFHYGACVRFDTLWIIITSLLPKVCVSGSTPSQLSLFHFYYGAACPVRHPFNCHYFTFTMICVRFNTLSIVIISFLLSCSFVGFDMLSIIIISLLLWCPSRFAYPFNCHYYGGFCFATLSIIIITGMSSNQTLSTRWVRNKPFCQGYF